MKCPVSGAKGMFSFILNRFFNVLFCWLLHRSSLEIKCPRSGAKKVNALLCLKIIPPTFYPTLNLTNSVKKANLRGKCICWSNHDILTAFTSLWATLWILWLAFHVTCTRVLCITMEKYQVCYWASLYQKSYTHAQRRINAQASRGWSPGTYTRKGAHRLQGNYIFQIIIYMGVCSSDNSIVYTN